MLPFDASLNHHGYWRNVLTELGVKPKVSGLPAAVECPSCHANRMTVYNDNRYKSQWYHCQACRFAGDAVALTLRVLDCGLAEAIARVGKTSTVNIDPVAYQRRMARPARALRFWAGCARPGDAHHTDEFATLLCRFGLSFADIENPNWASRCGRVIGFSTRRAYDELYLPGVLAGRNKHNNPNVTASAGGARLFTGRGWGPLLVIPFWDMPGRLSGFMMVGRNGESGDFVFKPLIPNSHGCARDAGIGMLPLMESTTPDASILITLDAIAAIRAHAAHFRDHTRPIPVLAAYAVGDCATSDSWNLFASRRLVMSGNSMESLQQAAFAGMRVAKPQPTTTQSVMRITGATISWRDAVEARLAACDDRNAEEFITSLKLDPQTARKFMLECDHPVKAKLARIYQHRDTRVATIKGRPIIEVDNQWFAVHTNGRKALISDAPFRIDYVAYNDDATRAVYRGFITFKGAAIAFNADSEAFDRNPFAWLRRHLHTKGVGVAFFDVSYAKYAVLIARQLHEPTTITVASRVEIDTMTGDINLPNYTQGGDGDIRETRLCVPDDDIDIVPCNNIAEPDGLTLKEYRLLDMPGDANALAMLIMAHCVTALTTPRSRGGAGTRLALAGNTTATVGIAMATAVGCRLAAVSAGTPHWQGKIDAVANAHDWPTLVMSKEPGGIVHLRASTAVPPHAIATVDACDVVYLLILGCWDAIRVDDVVLSPKLTAVLPRAVANYLQWTCQRGGISPLSTKQHLTAIGRWLQEGVGGKSSNNGAASRALQLTTFADTDAIAVGLTTLVCRDITNGNARYVKEAENNASRARTIIERTAGGVFIPASVLIQSAVRRLPPPQHAAIAAGLSAAGVLVDDRPYNDVAGWVIDSTWFAKRRREYSIAKTPLLRIVQ